MKLIFNGKNTTTGVEQRSDLFIFGIEVNVKPSHSNVLVIRVSNS